MLNLLVSACLLGVNCRYRGDACPGTDVKRLAERFGLIPVCPEQLGGLPTPRPPAELHGGRVVTANGGDVTEAFQKGAQEALRLAELFGCRYAVLKSRSPSCGAGCVYDGTFSGSLTKGDGVTAGLLKEAGLVLLNEDNAEEELNRLFPPENV